MSKKLVFPLVAVFSMGVAASFAGCSCGAEAKIGDNQAKAPEPPPPPPAPEPPPPPAPEPKATTPIKAVGKAKVVNDEIQIPGKIQFEFEKATIKNTPETQDILKTLAEVMKENPQITKLRIEGHTDDSGASDFNHKLSQARAEAVAEWLAKNGVDQSRLATVGLGEEHPLVPNDSKEHREQNRRTEFKVWEVDGKPTDVAKGAAAAPAGGDAKPADAKDAKPADAKAGDKGAAKPAKK